MTRATLSVLLVSFLAGLVHAQGGLDPSLLAGMNARPIGPAAMSGRIAAVVAVESDPNILYAGASTGGLWKSKNGGLSWKPLTDDLQVASIGAVAIDPNNPDVVWVGTGEGNPRNSASAGLGIWRSSDGGETFTHLGLEASRNIHRIILHPRDPDVAWVAALGDAWADSPERGVFRTTDRGRTWQRVLSAGPGVGAADLAADPRNPHKLYAALWDFRRRPWTFRSGGPGSGLHVSVDGGDTWKRLNSDDGLPEGELGRIGLAVAPSRPDTVYAYVETKKKNVISRSDDGGRSWKSVGKGDNIGNRPFYYADLRVDPANPERVYSLWSQVSVSDDGGKTFRVLVGWGQAHPDHHAMWINPNDPRHIIEGNDGGIAISRDHGTSWKYVRNLPLAQFYHVRVDDQVPYFIYGGLQDNGSWKGPSEVWESGGIRNHHWREVCFGDGFDTLPDPRDPMIGYAMSQEGFLVRWNLRNGERKSLRPLGPEGTKLRFNWNAGIAIDPADPDTIYFGSQFVHRSRDRGDNWEVISEDLTSNNPQWQKQAESGGLTPDVTGAENFTTILSIAPSPVKGSDVLWVGTDDGRVHVSRDRGATWTSVERNLPDLAPHTWIPQVSPSPHDAATAFVVAEDHRRGDWTPNVFKTTDHGETFTRLDTEDVRGYALSVLQDPVDPKLLFLGTELGLWVSLDGGKSWFQWRHGVPSVSVMDMAIQEREADLVLGTHGRACFVLDDIRPLREMTAELRKKKVHLFTPPHAWRHRTAQPASSRFPGQGEFRGRNRPYGARLSFWIGADDVPHPDKETERARDKEGTSKDKAVFEIKDASGEVIRTFKRSVKQGLNRATWPLRRKGYRRPGQKVDPEKEPRGSQVVPGVYEVTVKYRGEESSAKVEVRPDPRVPFDAEAMQAGLDAAARAGGLYETMAEVLDRIQDIRKDVDRALAYKPKSDDEKKPDDEKKSDTEKPAEEKPAEEKPAEEEPAEEKAEAEKDPVKALEAAAEALRKELKEIEKALRKPPGGKGYTADESLMSRLSRAARGIGSHDGRPTGPQTAGLERGEKELRELVARLNACESEKLAAFRQKVRELELVLVPERTAIELK